jgi:hypothetical protein
LADEKKRERFVAMEQGAAMRECSSSIESRVLAQCPACSQQVYLHCSTCKIQTTGCLCTEVDRFGNDEAWKRACERFGEEMARERYREAGLYVPTVAQPDRIILPGEG